MKQIPEQAQAYKRTPEFNQDTVPQGLLNAHQTKEGTWGKIVVLEGQLQYTINEPEVEVIMLDQNTFGVVEPTILHQVKLMGDMRFYVEFYRVAE